MIRLLHSQSNKQQVEDNTCWRMHPLTDSKIHMTRFTVWLAHRRPGVDAHQTTNLIRRATHTYKHFTLSLGYLKEN